MFKSLLRLVPFFSLALCLAQAQDVTGDWLGTLAKPAGDVRLALHISKADHGLKATLDSVDEGVKGIPLDSFQFTDSKVTFNLNGKASYDGKVDAAGTAIEGSFVAAEGSMPVNFRRGTVAKVEHKPAQPTDIDGDWAGTLTAGAKQVDVIFHITNTADGLMATLDEPAEHVTGAVASSVTRNAAALAIEWKVFGSRFEGKIAADRSAIEGSVTLSGGTLPLTLKRTKP